MANSCGLDKDAWAHLKGMLISEVKDLICPSDANICMETFSQRTKVVSDVLWFIQATEVAECWDLYCSRSDRWAMPRRREIVEALFAASTEMPMLSRSNNATEAFFSVLKYHILDGKSVTTFTQFLTIWAIYEARLYSNVVRSGALEHMDGIVERKVEFECDPFALEDGENEGYDGTISENQEDATEEHQVEAAENETDEESRNIDIVQLRAERDAMQSSSLRSRLLELAQKIPLHIGEMLNASPPVGLRALQCTTRSLENAEMFLLASRSTQFVDNLALSFINVPAVFARQAGNYGTAVFEVPSANAVALASATDSGRVTPLQRLPDSGAALGGDGFSQSLIVKATLNKVDAAGSLSSDTASSLLQVVAHQAVDDKSIVISEPESPPNISVPPNPVSFVGDVIDPVPTRTKQDAMIGPAILTPVSAPTLASAAETIDASLMGKKKKKSSANTTVSDERDRPAWIHKQSFTDYANQLLSNPVAHRTIELAKAQAKDAGLPLLRAALANNCTARIRGLMYEFFGAIFPKSISKTELISRSMQHLLALATIPKEIAESVADLGRVHTPDENLLKDEILFLKTNSTSSTGELCVAGCQNLCGWALRDKTFVYFEMLNVDKFYWGRLIEKRRDWAVMTAI